MLFQRLSQGFSLFFVDVFLKAKGLRKWIVAPDAPWRPLRAAGWGFYSRRPLEALHRKSIYIPASKNAWIVQSKASESTGSWRMRFLVGKLDLTITTYIKCLELKTYYSCKPETRPSTKLKRKKTKHKADKETNKTRENKQRSKQNKTFFNLMACSFTEVISVFWKVIFALIPPPERV